MLKNYLKIAFRSLLKYKLFSFINITGLALGMACSMLIGMWVHDELSYNTFYPRAKDIYLVRPAADVRGKQYVGEATSGPWQTTLQGTVPGMEAVVKMTWNRDLLVKVGEKSAKESGLFATADYFKVFRLPFLAGTADKAIAAPASVAISRKLAEKYFGTVNAVGKHLKLDNRRELIVSGVFENIPTNATERFDWIVNFQVQEEDWMKTWGNSSFKTYALLAAGANPARVEQSARAVIKKARPPHFLDFPLFQPAADAYLYSEYQGFTPTGGRIEYVRTFTIVAVFILLIACVNFVNLATARSVKRAKEVGVRKVVGAQKSLLIAQFMGEAIIVSLAAAVLGLMVVAAFLPLFNTIVGKSIFLSDYNLLQWSYFLLFALATGIVAGSYPAIYLAALQPVKTLKGQLTKEAKGAWLRKGLVIGQFGLSVFLIIGVIVVGKQMRYIQSKRLGLERENVVYIPLEGDLDKNLETFRQRILDAPSIMAATTTGDLPTNITGTSGDLSWAGKTPEVDNTVAATFVGYDFAKTMHIQMASGRDFSTDFPGDTVNYIINEATARLMKMKDPVGQQIKFWMGTGTIVGVMKDFHLNSFHSAIKPLVFAHYKGLNTAHLLVRTQPGQTQQALAHIEKVAKIYNPNYPFNYHFLDEDFERMYKSEMIVNTLIRYFGFLAIVISSLGLLGLAAFTAEQRTKEIGIRKVLGASISGVVTLLSTEFVQLVLISLVISCPLSWWLMNQWLADFAYHIDISWDVFVLAAVAALAVALFTVSFQTIRAALLNPVKSLQSE